MRKWFYEKNAYLLDHDVNKTFEQVLWMTTDEFRQWCIDLRQAVVYSWDELGIPPRVGYNEDQIIDQFQQMESFPVNKFWITDANTGNKDVIRNTHNLGNAINQFFPGMMKTRINYTDDVEAGKSIYDYFARDDLYETFVTYASRHFKRDSFYHYSNPIEIGDTQYGNNLPYTDNPVEWILKFEIGDYRLRGVYDYWLAPVKDKTEYTGYNGDLKGKKYLTLTSEDIKPRDDIPEECKTNVDYTKSELYQIRVFKLGQRLFPIGFKAFRVSFCQYAVQYPPLIAKLIYETLTEEFKKDENIVVWDPSSGWGGRLLGAMSVKEDRNITYLGNDPNTDHNTTNDRTKYHEIYDFYRGNVRKGGGLYDIPHNAFKFWQLGSEVIQYDQEFQRYKGQVSVVFTSPPYWGKEAYSEDDAQSYKKFPQYETWKQGFLYETLKTAYEWLRPNGYLAWNISDIKMGKNILPLVDDSMIICQELGFKHLRTYKMSLAQSPGANRVNADGTVTAKYSYKTVDGMIMKFEPILIFQK